MYDYLLRRKSDNKMKIAVLLIIVIAFFGGIIIGSFSREVPVPACNDTVIGGTGEPVQITMQPIGYSGITDESHARFAAIRIPAVDKDENGVITVLTVQVVPGSGSILTNIDKLLFWVDTQNSIRKATTVGEMVTGQNLTEYDIIYNIQANASVIGGPSAGAAITMATIAALLNRSVNESVMITGSVNHDGTIGPVGGVYEKALVSKEIGAEVFLVPLTQSTQITYQTRQYCEKIGWMDFCTTETYPVKVDVQEQSGIKIVEIMTIQEAMDYMLV